MGTIKYFLADVGLHKSSLKRERHEGLGLLSYPVIIIHLITDMAKGTLPHINLAQNIHMSLSEDLPHTSWFDLFGLKYCNIF